MKRKLRILNASRLIPLAIFACAFAVRMAFVLQVKGSAYWRIPSVDALLYDVTAQEMLKSGWLASVPPGPYFQPPFYQAFLALIYLVFGHSTLVAQVIQYLIGSATCVLIYLIGQRFFGRTVGIIAGFATAFTASQIFYEGLLVPPALITILNLTVIFLAAKQLSTPAVWRWPVMGLLVGISAIARPDILMLVPALLVWMWIERRTVFSGKRILWTAILLIGVILPVGLVGLRNLVVGKDFQLISFNGGLNFFIGNHPHMEKTLGIRPGMRWTQFLAVPMEEGVTKPSQISKWYYQHALLMMWKCKRATISNLEHKFVWVWRGPEIRRNEDDYFLTRVSSVYRALLWRKGNFGFPFGVIGPLALIGMVMSIHRRRELFLLYSYIATQVLMLVIFFPCSRYRAPMVPVLIVFAATASVEIVHLIKKREVGRILLVLCLLVSFVTLSVMWPPKFEGTPASIEAEDCRVLGDNLFAEGRPDESLAAYEQGIKLAPSDPDLNACLMHAYYEKGDYAKAEKHAVTCLLAAPRFRSTYEMLIAICVAEGKYDRAEVVENALEEARPDLY